MPTLSQLQTWLTEAYAARHLLRTGGMAEMFSRDGRVVKYTAASAGDLDAYIAQLESEISAGSTGTARRRTYRVTQVGTGY